MRVHIRQLNHAHAGASAIAQEAEAVGYTVNSVKMIEGLMTMMNKSHSPGVVGKNDLA